MKEEARSKEEEGRNKEEDFTCANQNVCRDDPSGRLLGGFNGRQTIKINGTDC